MASTSIQILNTYEAMLKGCKMHKFEPGTKGKLKGVRAKNVFLSPDMESIMYSPMKKKGRIDISTLISVENGENYLDELQPFRARFPTSSCFSLNNEGTGRVFFAAPTTDIANLWIRGLKTLIQNQTAKEKANKRREEWFAEAFTTLDKAKAGKITFTDLLNFMTAEKLPCDPLFLKKTITKLLHKDTKAKGQSNALEITKEEFIKFLKYFLTRKEVVALFFRVSSDGAFISPEELEPFLTHDQAMNNVTREHCRDLIKAFEVTQPGRRNCELSYDGFLKYLMSRNGKLFNPEHDKVYQDMTQPMTHYYIASSHNTYLTGDQLRDDSSVQMYIDALNEGCRCVEIDCWDGDEDDIEPVVYHGHTLTSKILFKDIIVAVKEHAFKTTPYPLILSLENHCSVKFQEKMAFYLREILGDSLWKTPVDERYREFPSPEFFKEKIFIRSKKLKPEQEETRVEGEDEFELTDDDDDDEEDDDDDDDDPQHDNDQSDGFMSKSKKKPPKAIAKDLSRLINYVSNVHFVSFENSKRDGKFWQSSSFAEKKMEKFVEKSPVDFIEYNKRQFTRVYPGNLRVDSSNYDPQQAWNVGCQLVALNHQTKSEPMHLHYGRFRQNGGAGYVLKPVFLRNPGLSSFNPLTITEDSHEGINSKNLMVKIISGQQLHAPDGGHRTDDIDPYVKVDVYGIPVDNCSFSTKVVKKNGLNPVWNESFQSRVVVPELALIRFCVYDEDIGYDDFIGQATIPFMSMRQGYRHVTLLNRKGEPATCGTLFVHVTISDSDIVMASGMTLEAIQKDKKCTIM